LFKHLPDNQQHITPIYETAVTTIIGREAKKPGLAWHPGFDFRTVPKEVPLMSYQPISREGYVPVDNAELFYREVGHGRPIILIHGGPDFDHTYLLPDMDRLSDSYRLIYYDQRGRGKSGKAVHPDDVSMSTEIDDLESLRKYLQLDTVAVLGHSWGGVLAMAYAIRHSDQVSHMILMNTAAASGEDYLLLRQEIRSRKAAYEAELNVLVSSAAYQEGDPDAVAAYYRIQYSTTIKKPAHVDQLMENMRLGFTKENILKGRAIEARLYDETWLSGGFDLFPRLERLTIPTLIIHGDYDFVPTACATHIAQAIHGAHCAVLKECGHFAYIESPDEVRKEISDFFAVS
jgi:proline iminopeptidase